MEATAIDTLDRRFHALADDTRRRIWLQLRMQPGATTTELSDAIPRLSRWAVMKHLSVLRDAGLIQTLPQGRLRRHYRVERSIDPIRTWLSGASERDP